MPTPSSGAAAFTGRAPSVRVTNNLTPGTDVTYPSGFRLPLFLADPHQLEDYETYDEVEQGLGETRVRPMLTTVPKKVTGKWRVLWEDMQLFIRWYEEDLQGGTLSFNVDVVNYGVGIKTYSGTFLQPYKTTTDSNAEALWWDIDAILLLRPVYTPPPLPGSASSGIGPCNQIIYFLDNFSVKGTLPDHIPDKPPTSWLGWTTDAAGDGPLYVGYVTLDASASPPIDTTALAEWDDAFLLASTGFSISFDYDLSEFEFIKVFVKSDLADDDYVCIHIIPTAIYVYDRSSTVAGAAVYRGYSRSRIKLHIGPDRTFLDVNDINFIPTANMPVLADWDFSFHVAKIKLEVGQKTRFDRVVLYRDDCEYPGTYGFGFAPVPASPTFAFFAGGGDSGSGPTNSGFTVGKQTFRYTYSGATVTAGAELNAFRTGSSAAGTSVFAYLFGGEGGTNAQTSSKVTYSTDTSAAGVVLGSGRYQTLDRCATGTNTTAYLFGLRPAGGAANDSWGQQPAYGVAKVDYAGDTISDGTNLAWACYINNHIQTATGNSTLAVQITGRDANVLTDEAKTNKYTYASDTVAQGTNLTERKNFATSSSSPTKGYFFSGFGKNLSGGLSDYPDAEQLAATGDSEYGCGTAIYTYSGDTVAWGTALPNGRFSASATGNQAKAIIGWGFRYTLDGVNGSSHVGQGDFRTNSTHEYAYSTDTVTNGSNLDSAYIHVASATSSAPGGIA